MGVQTRDCFFGYHDCGSRSTWVWCKQCIRKQIQVMLLHGPKEMVSGKDGSSSRGRDRIRKTDEESTPEPQSQAGISAGKSNTVINILTALRASQGFRVTAFEKAMVLIRNGFWSMSYPVNEPLCLFRILIFESGWGCVFRAEGQLVEPALELHHQF